jgi:hypothetical protein
MGPRPQPHLTTPQHLRNCGGVVDLPPFLVPPEVSAWASASPFPASGIERSERPLAGSRSCKNLRCWRPAAKRTVRPHRVVVSTPSLDGYLAPVSVQTISQLSSSSLSLPLNRSKAPAFPRAARINETRLHADLAIALSLPSDARHDHSDWTGWRGKGQPLNSGTPPEGPHEAWTERTQYVDHLTHQIDAITPLLA